MPQGVQVQLQLVDEDNRTVDSLCGKLQKHQQNHLLAAAESVVVIPPSIAGELHVKPMFGVVESFYLVRVTHTFVERLKPLKVFLLGRLRS